MAVTIKAKAKGAAKALRDLLADKDLPKDLRDGVEGVISALQKKWSDLAAEVEPEAEAAQPPYPTGTMSPALPPNPSPTGMTSDLGEGGDEVVGDYVPLIEKAIRSDGIVPIKIIQPGWGSSGFYPPEVLERDGPKIFAKGLKMFWNHPTASEEAERPERDLNDLAAELVTDARWQATGPAGAGLYADAKVFEGYKPAVDDLAKSIGVSIRAYGKAQNGTMEGKSGPIITELTAAKSVDFVTAPGAGGQILTLFEAARQKGQPVTNPNAGQPANSNTEVDMEKLQELQDANAALQQKLDEVLAETARQREALILREARDAAWSVLGKASLPDATKTRLVESLTKAAPVKDNALDKDAFATQIAEAVKAEVKYLTEAAGLGEIRGLGESGDGEPTTDSGANMEEAFKSMGLSKASAKVAAQGRG